MDDQSHALHVLQSMADAVQELPTGDTEQADFLATFGRSRVLIEEKTKFDDPKIDAERYAALRSGKLHSRCTPLARNNRVSGIVGKAAKQLASSAKEEHDFRIVWFTGAGRSGEARYEQFINTIYGATSIVERNSTETRKCYFFRNSDFYRYRSVLDGAVAAYIANDQIHLKLCLNPLSSNYYAMKESDFVAKFGNAIEDPVAHEEAGEAFIIDGPIDRSDNASLLDYLKKKYETDCLMDMDMGHVEASILVPKGER